MAAIDYARVSYGRIGRIGTVIGSVFSTVVGWNDARVTRNALSKLTDRELEDIGMVRGDIDDVARNLR